VKDANGEVLSKEFFANQLQKVPDDTTPIRDINEEKINEINNVPVVDFSIRNENYTPPPPVATRTRTSLLRNRIATRNIVRLQRGVILDCFTEL
jgi:hypothetical protein